jgi:hypothetical protein
MKLHKFISSTLVVLALAAASASANVQQGPITTADGQQVPQGLWEAFSEARLLIEPARDTSNGARFAGQNPANRIRFTFNENGVTYYPFDRPGEDWSLGMRLTSYGGTPITTQKLHLDGNRVTIDRGNVQEWYVNRPDGLEQGFTLAAPPDGATGEKITLSMTLTGDLQARWKVEGKSVQFFTETEDYVFSYDKLLVTDAGGKHLSAHMQLSQNELQLQFDVTGAEWPVTVDPLSYTETKLQGRANAAESGDRFGFSVDILDDYALIGASQDYEGGSAYLFWYYSGSWRLYERFVGDNPQPGDQFGHAVALMFDVIGYNDFVFVGAPQEDGTGAVHSFLLGSHLEEYKPSDIASGDEFGCSMSTSDFYLLVGSCFDDDGGDNSGSAYLLELSGDYLFQDTKLTASDAAAHDVFGTSVSVTNDTAVVGAAYDDDAGLNSGSAYVFYNNGTSWSQQAKLTASDAAAGDLFGSAVAVSEDAALVGAYGDDTATGSAYLFTRSGGTWTQDQKLAASDAATGDAFGYSVALDGNYALIGAYQDDDGGADSGSAYVFYNNGTSWVEQAKLTASDAATGDLFGHSVAVDGDTALVGAYMGDSGVTDGGSAYMFTRSGTTWSEDEVIFAVGRDHFGNSAALFGDTALIGAYGDDEAGGYSGSAYVFVRSGSTWSLQQKLIGSDTVYGDEFGHAVALWGDTALIGTPWGGSYNGSAYVFTRNSGTWTQQQILTASDAAIGDSFGRSVALEGDTALIGADGDDDGGAGSGSVYVFTRAGNTWTQQQKLTASDAGAGDVFGISVALDGDTALIGAERDDDGGTESGSAYVFVNSGTAWSQQQKLTASDAEGHDYFGYSVALDGDRALVGASGGNDAGLWTGAAYMFTRLGNTWTQEQKLTAPDAATYDYFGHQVSLDGDVALIGAYGDDDGATDNGSVYIFIRTANGWTQQEKLDASDAANYDYFGLSLDLSDDTVLIGATGRECSLGDSCGAAFVYHFACGYGREVLSNRWTMISNPCDPGVSNTVEDILGDNFNPSRYYSRWVVYDRNESTDAYEQMGLSSPMVLGQGYWLISLDATVWDANGTETPRSLVEDNCPSADGCYVIDLVAPGAGEDPRFNLIGHPFSFDTEWADVRFDVNGVAYSPKQAESAGYAEKEMWIYNGNAYDVWDDDTPGMEGTLEAQDGIWVAVLNGAAGKTVKLLVPVFNTFGTPPPPPTLP